MNVLPPDEAAEHIRARGIRLELARALDCWSGMRRRTPGRKEQEWKALLKIAKAADPEPNRNQLREALEHDDRAALRSLAVSADVEQLPAATLQLLGWTLGQIGDADQAVTFLRRAQRRYPADLWLNELLGHHCLKSLHRYGDAVRFYTAARAVRPRNVNLIFNLGYALLRNYAFAEAAGEFTEAIKLDPDFAEVYSYRADAYMNLREADRAIADCTRAIELSPTSAERWYNRANLYNNLDFGAKALADAERAIELEGNHPWAWVARGRAHDRLKQWDEAVADLSRAVELDSNCDHAWNMMAWFFATAAEPGVRKPDRAVEAARRAIAINPAEGDYWVF